MVQSSVFNQTRGCNFSKAFSPILIEKGFDIEESKVTKIVSLIKERHILYQNFFGK
jgi:hypothetical protein